MRLEEERIEKKGINLVVSRYLASGSQSASTPSASVLRWSGRVPSRTRGMPAQDGSEGR